MTKKPTNPALEFNEDAVRHVLFLDKTYTAVAEEFGILELTLKAWVRAINDAMPKDSSGRTPLDELAELKAENRALLAEHAALLAEHAG